MQPGTAGVDIVLHGRANGPASGSDKSGQLAEDEETIQTPDPWYVVKFSHVVQFFIGHWKTSQLKQAL
jgi:hypothetical protein